MGIAGTRIHALALAVMVAAAGTSSAHVTVSPRQAPAKASQELTIRVPNEKEVATESIRLQFPAELEVVRLKPMAGWTSEIERNAAGKITGVTWSGNKIGRQEYQDFYLIARLPEQPGPIRIKAYQNYAGGVEVAWVNDAEPQPAPMLTVTPAASPAPGDAAPSAASPSAPTVPVAAGAGMGGTLGGISIAISILAMVVALRSGRRRAG